MTLCAERSEDAGGGQIVALKIALSEFSHSLSQEQSDSRWAAMGRERSWASCPVTDLASFWVPDRVHDALGSREKPDQRFERVAWIRQRP